MGARRYGIYLRVFKLISHECKKYRINTCEKLSYQNTCADTIFLSGRNPYNTLEFI